MELGLAMTLSSKFGHGEHGRNAQCLSMSSSTANKKNHPVMSFITKLEVAMSGTSHH